MDSTRVTCLREITIPNRHVQVGWTWDDVTHLLKSRTGRDAPVDSTIGWAPLQQRASAWKAARWSEGGAWHASGWTDASWHGSGASSSSSAFFSLGRRVMFEFLLYARARTIPNYPSFNFVALIGLYTERIDRQISMNRSMKMKHTFTTWIGFAQEEVQQTLR
jgi:hypothetical protein